MGQKLTLKMSLFPVTDRHDIGKGLGVFSEILDATPEMLDRVYNDPIRNSRKETGRPGMTAEQALRVCVLKQYRSYLVEGRTHDYKRNGVTSLYAAFNILTGEVIGRVTARHRAKECKDIYINSINMGNFPFQNWRKR